MIASLTIALLTAYAAPQARGSASWCLYFVDAKGENVYRCRTDGSHRELVIRSRSVRPAAHPKLSLAPSWPDASLRGTLALSNIPSHEGFTILDASRPTKLGNPMRWEFRDEMGRGPKLQEKGEVSFADSLSPSGWQLIYECESAAVEPGHVHSHIGAIIFAGRGHKRRLRITGGYGSRLLSLFSDSRAFVFDRGHVISWNLMDDSRTVVASAASVAIWPRDLRSPARFAPVAACYVRHSGKLRPGFYKWTLRNPDDLQVKSSYLKKAVKDR